jgi:hypothetical protein
VERPAIEPAVPFFNGGSTMSKTEKFAQAIRDFVNAAQRLLQCGADQEDLHAANSHIPPNERFPTSVSAEFEEIARQQQLAIYDACHYHDKAITLAITPPFQVNNLDPPAWLSWAKQRIDALQLMLVSRGSRIACAMFYKSVDKPAAMKLIEELTSLPTEIENWPDAEAGDPAIWLTHAQAFADVNIRGKSKKEESKIMSIIRTKAYSLLKCEKRGNVYHYEPAS